MPVKKSTTKKRTTRPYVPILVGTARKGSASKKLAPYLKTELQKAAKSLRFEVLEASDFAKKRTIPNWEDNDHTAAWQKIAKKAAAFVLIVPEYNHGYPSELKNILDQDAIHYLGKPVLLVGVSVGAFGGVRVIDHLQPVLTELGMTNVPYPLIFPNIDDVLDQPEKERNATYQRRIKKSATALATYEQHLRGIAKTLSSL
jgi:NAD(P)H-dependent FMN reductase